MSYIEDVRQDMHRRKYKMTPSYTEAEQYINHIQKFAKKNTLSHTRMYLQALGIEEETFAGRIIHVAGTNGKGSVCNYLTNLLLAEGFHVGTFISPHLVHMRERIRLDNRMIPEAEFVTAYEAVRQVIDAHAGQEAWYHPTFFEFLFLMAMYVYKEKMPDYLVLETGLGGRLDATNVFSKPVLTIITEIGLDHCRYLGDTKEKIAAEKAGIIQEGVPLIYVRRDPETENVLLDTAKEKKAEAFAVDKSLFMETNITDKGIDFSYKSRYYNTISFHLSTYAAYQMENASASLLALEHLLPKEKMQPSVIQQAVAESIWEGRMEEIADRVYLDGAHNADGIEAFLDSVRHLPVKGERILVFSVVNDKAYTEMIHELVSAGLFTTYMIAGIHDARGVDDRQLRDIFTKYSAEQVYDFADASAAFSAALSRRKPEDAVFIVGSLYLAGEIKACLEEAEGGKNDQL